MFECRSWDVIPNAHKYLCGLLQTEKTMRNMERIAEEVPDVDYQSMQQFISDSPWSSRAVMNKVARDAAQLLGGAGEVGLLLDETYFQKTGKSSVGVARQWNGRLGKVENSQVAVFAALACGDRATLIDCEFYLPREWTESPERLRKVRVPQERFAHKTKLELAKDIVDRQSLLEVGFDYVCADGLYGQSGIFCRELDDAGVEFLLHVHKDQAVYLEDPDPRVCETATGRGRQPSKLQAQTEAVRVGDLVASLKDCEWERLITRETTRGPLAIYAFSRPIWVWDGEEKKARSWTLFVRRDFESGDLKYALSNDGGRLSTLNLARREMQRYRVERSFQDGKQEVGMADYQTRGWVAWHHHMALVMMAMLFITRVKMVHGDEMPMLSLADVRTMLAFFLPKAKVSKKEVFAQMLSRHEARKAATELKSARKNELLHEADFPLHEESPP